jgi:hypothetical protein
MVSSSENSLHSWWLFHIELSVYRSAPFVVPLTGGFIRYITNIYIRLFGDIDDSLTGYFYDFSLFFSLPKLGHVLKPKL